MDEAVVNIDKINEREWVKVLKKKIKIIIMIEWESKVEEERKNFTRYFYMSLAKKVLNE
jgi:hypothetical protein